MGMLAGTPSGLVDVENGAIVAFAGRDVVAVGGPWAVLDGRTVAHRDDGATALDAPAGTALLCVDGGPGGNVLAGAAGANLYRAGQPLERIEAFDATAGHDEWYTPWGGPPDVRSLAVASDGTVLVNVHVGGIVRSTDGGASWHPTIDIHADVHQVLALDGGRALAACAVGLAVSADGGASWAVHDDGLHATYARSVAVAGATVLLGVSSGPGGSGAAVYRRPLDGDIPFERSVTGLPADLGGNVDTFRLAGSPDGTAAVATASGDVFVSVDEGATWAPVGDCLPAVRCLLLE